MKLKATKLVFIHFINICPQKFIHRKSIYFCLLLLILLLFSWKDIIWNLKRIFVVMQFLRNCSQQQ